MKRILFGLALLSVVANSGCVMNQYSDDPTTSDQYRRFAANEQPSYVPADAKTARGQVPDRIEPIVEDEAKTATLPAVTSMPPGGTTTPVPDVSPAKRTLRQRIAGLFRAKPVSDSTPKKPS